MGLLSLPPELRDRIYEFAVWHEDNEGYISPIDHYWKNLKRFSSHRTIIQGQPKSVSYLHNKAGGIWRKRLLDFGEVAAPNGGLICEVSAYMQDVGTCDWAGTPFTGGTPFTRHVCSPSCLLQPALTRVNRQIREEALPVFYRCNKFVLEAANFTFYTYNGYLREDVLSMPMRWMRSICDTNLRMLQHLHVTSHKSVGFRGDGETLRFEFVYERGSHGVYVSVKKAQGWDAETQMDDPQLVDLSDRAEYEGAVARMKEAALFVRGIETVLAAGELFGVRRRAATG